MLCSSLVSYSLALASVPNGQDAPAPEIGHAFFVTPVFVLPRPGLALSYELDALDRLTASARLEYLFPGEGWWHLQGVHESVGLAVWAGRPHRGFFLEGSFGVGHQFFVKAPELSKTALGPGLGAGGRWTFGRFVFGGHATFRWQTIVAGDDAVCTSSAECAVVQEGLRLRFGLDFGVTF